MRYVIKQILRGKFRGKLVRSLFYEHLLDDIPEIAPKIPLTIRILEHNNISEIKNVKNLSSKILNKRLENGDLCFSTEASGSFISFHWLQTSGKHYIEPIGKVVSINSGEAVIYHVLVQERFRGNRINGFVYSEILQHCLSIGINRVWVYTDQKNIANQKGLERLNFNIYKRTLSLRINNRSYLVKSSRV